MKYLLFILLTLFSILVVFRLVKIINKGKIKTLPNQDTQLESTYPSLKAEGVKNPFGVMLPVNSISIPKRIEIARELGVSFYRPNDIQPVNLNCPECDAAKNAGLKLILTVRNGEGARTQATPPKDKQAYKNFISEVLDRYKPYLLVVENEQNSSLFYNGTAEEYLEELKLACEVAHLKGFKCADGGIVNSLVIMLVANEYEKQGKPKMADLYLKKALDPENYRKIVSSKNTSIYKNQIETGTKLLEGYKKAGADYANFHWYSSSSEAFEEAVLFLRKKTGLPLITNEMGQQKSDDPTVVTSLMEKVVKLDLPIAVWFSADIPIFGQARGLVDANGNLKENGLAFKKFIETNF